MVNESVSAKYGVMEHLPAVFQGRRSSFRIFTGVVLGPFHQADFHFCDPSDLHLPDVICLSMHRVRKTTRDAFNAVKNLF